MSVIKSIWIWSKVDFPFSCSLQHNETFMNHFCGLIRCLSSLPWWLSGKESACQCRRPGFNPWVGKIPWRKAWLRTPVFLPRESQGQRLRSMGSQRGGHSWAKNTSTSTSETRLWNSKAEVILKFMKAAFPGSRTAPAMGQGKMRGVNDAWSALLLLASSRPS